MAKRKPAARSRRPARQAASAQPRAKKRVRRASPVRPSGAATRKTAAKAATREEGPRSEGRGAADQHGEAARLVRKSQRSAARKTRAARSKAAKPVPCGRPRGRPPRPPGPAEDGQARQARQARQDCPQGAPGGGEAACGQGQAGCAREGRPRNARAAQEADADSGSARAVEAQAGPGSQPRTAARTGRRRRGLPLPAILAAGSIAPHRRPVAVVRNCGTATTTTTRPARR